jgi:hypothetical protein
MEDLYSIHPGISRAGAAASEASSGVAGGGGSPPPQAPPPPPSPADLTELVKAQIAGHPRYPTLLSAYIECRKVRLSTPIIFFMQQLASQELRKDCVFDACSSLFLLAGGRAAGGCLAARGDRPGEVRRLRRRRGGRPRPRARRVHGTRRGARLLPHSVQFLPSLLCVVITCDVTRTRCCRRCVQDAYCRVLERYKEEVSRPLHEAASFLSSVRSQLSALCGSAAASLSGNSCPLITCSTVASSAVIAVVSRTCI